MSTVRSKSRENGSDMCLLIGKEKKEFSKNTYIKEKEKQLNTCIKEKEKQLKTTLH
jgi:hypothetical protein